MFSYILPMLMEANTCRLTYINYDNLSTFLSSLKVYVWLDVRYSHNGGMDPLMGGVKEIRQPLRVNG